MVPVPGKVISILCDIQDIAIKKQIENRPAGNMGDSAGGG